MKQKKDQSRGERAGGDLTQCRDDQLECCNNNVVAASVDS